MAQRILPGAYVSLQDKSQVPEGQLALTVGYVLAADRGPVNQLKLVTSPADFLTKYTFSGKPSLTADPTFHSILNVLPRTNTMYVARAAKDPVDGGPGYGGVIVRKLLHLGEVQSANKENRRFTVKIVDLGQIGWFTAGSTVAVSGTGTNDGYYSVAAVADGATDDVKTITVNEDLVQSGTYTSAKMYTNPIFPLTSFGLGTIVSADASTHTFMIKETPSNIARLAVGSRFTVKGAAETANNKTFTLLEVGTARDNKIPIKVLEDVTTTLSGDMGAVVSANASTHTITFNTSTTLTSYISAGLLVAGSKFTVTEATETANNKEFTVVSVDTTTQSGQVIITVTEDVTDASGEGNHGTAVLSIVHGNTSIQSLATPDGFTFSPVNNDHLMIITGADPGSYNGKLEFAITSSEDKPNDLAYYPGALIGDEPCTFGTMRLDVYNSETKELLESFTFSRDRNATTIDGRSLYVDDVVAGSAYIKIINNPDVEGLPASTVTSKPVVSSGGYDGVAVDASTLASIADRVFSDETLSISILGNGCSAAAETEAFQKKLLSIANTRKDCFVFLNSRSEDENYTLPSDRTSAIVSYKKDNLVSTSFYGCMYAPHVNTTDVYNQRQVKIGAEAVAIAGWLDVINNLNYPYAYAGPRNGLVEGVTCDWKIGDASGEAQVLNDASINYVAYDGKVGRYYMQCQNTLQIANSAMRNIGTVLNVLDIKEHFVILLKEYLQLPITDDLRREIMDVANDYLSPMNGVRFSNYAFQDVTRDIDLADNTLRYLLTLAPTPYAARIYLVMNIVNATFDFSILQSL